jgi:hypothetical protein
MLRRTEFLPGSRKLQRGSVIRTCSRAELPLPLAETLRNSASTADTLFSFVLPPLHFIFCSSCCLLLYFSFFFCVILLVFFPCNCRVSALSPSSIPEHNALQVLRAPTHLGPWVCDRKTEMNSEVPITSVSGPYTNSGV